MSVQLVPRLDSAEHIDSYLDKVDATLNSTESELAGKVANKADFISGTIRAGASLRERYEKLKQGIDEVGLPAVLADSKSEISQEMEAISKNAKLLQVLSCLQSIHTMMLQADSKASSGDLLAAARLIHDAFGIFDSFGVPTADKKPPRVYNVLREQLRRRRTGIKQQLERLFNSAVSVQDGKTLYIVKMVGEQIKMPLTNLLQALHVFNMLEEKMMTLVHRVLTPFICNIASEKFMSAFIDVSASNKFKVWALVTFGSTSKKVRKIREQAQHAFGNVSTVLELIQVHLFNEVSSFDPQIGEILLRKASDTMLHQLNKELIKNCLTSFIPEHSADLVEYQDIIEETLLFESNLAKSGWLSRECLEDGYELSKFTREVDIHFAQKRRRHALEQAREVMLNYHHETVIVDLPTLREQQRTPKSGTNDKSTSDELPESYFKFPRCRVRQSTLAILKLAQELIDEATTQPPHSAANLVVTARDIFEMYRAVVPVHHGDKLENVPTLGMLFHNDCMYMAHVLLTLGHTQRAKLPEDVRPLVSFVDMVIPLRKLAEHYYFIQMRKQRKDLNENLASAEGLSDTNLPHRYQVVSTCIRRVTHRLFQLHKVWSDILPAEPRNRCIGALAEIVVRYFVNEAMALRDISEDETHRLHELLKSLFKLVELYPTPDLPIFVYVKSWSKLQKLIPMYEMRMVDMVGMFNSGHLPEFSRDEMIHLIKALFSDTDFRRDNINNLANR